MLLCAEKRGRFIPCRGGGTNTTYYTDGHNVDEDIRTIIDQGGRYDHDTWAGITSRYIYDDPSYSTFSVASRLIYLS